MRKNPVMPSRLRKTALQGRRPKLRSFYDLKRAPHVGEYVLVKTQNLNGPHRVDMIAPTYVLFEHEMGGAWQVSLKDIYPLAEHRKNPDSDVQAAARVYEETHWGDRPDGVHSVPKAERAQPRVGTAMGEVVKIQYLTSKAGEEAIYEHEFDSERPVLVFGKPPRGKRNRLYFIGGDYDVDADGIRG